MKDYLKFLKKLPKPQRQKIIQVILRISKNNLTGLDIKKLSTDHKLYRCRVGKIRILFQGRPDENYILDIGFRGGIYQNPVA